MRLRWKQPSNWGWGVLRSGAECGKQLGVLGAIESRLMSEDPPNKKCELVSIFCLTSLFYFSRFFSRFLSRFFSSFILKVSVGDRFGIKGKPDPSARLLCEAPFLSTLHSHQPFKPGGVIFPPEVTRERRERAGLGSGLQISRLFAVGGGISLSPPAGGWADMPSSSSRLQVSAAVPPPRQTPSKGPLQIPRRAFSKHSEIVEEG